MGVSPKDAGSSTKGTENDVPLGAARSFPAEKMNHQAGSAFACGGAPVGIINRSMGSRFRHGGHERFALLEAAFPGLVGNRAAAGHRFADALEEAVREGFKGFFRAAAAPVAHEQGRGLTLHGLPRLVPQIEVVEEGLDRAGGVGEIIRRAQREGVRPQDVFQGDAADVRVHQRDFAARVADPCGDFLGQYLRIAVLLAVIDDKDVGH